MKTISIIWLASLAVRPVFGALVGYGIYPYDPPCAFACHRSLSSLMLQCSGDMASGGHMGGHSDMISPQCRAGDTPWLTTLAWCMRTKCAEFYVSTSELESFWETQSTGNPAVAPKWSYSSTLFNVTQAPTQELTLVDDTLNSTALVSPSVYEAQYNALTAVQRENVVESGYGIALLVTGFGTPILLTWLGYIPFISSLLDKIRPYLVYPSIIGAYQIRPLPCLLGNAPTVGQGLYVIMFFILNIVLTAVNYESKQPHAWYATKQKEITAYIFYRTGVLAFVSAPLIILFSSRNNILLWMTNWSHSTFLLLHRWVARIFALQVLLHTLLALPLYYPAEAKKEYWIWGAVATIAVMILVVGSGLYVRLFAYEFFLISHIVLSIFVLVGCWYHIKLWIGLTWGYETWLYAACAVWFFDRLARVGRVVKLGPRRAKVTDLGGGYVRVDIVGIRWGSEPGKHVYAFFPTLNALRPWENHPFSVLQTASLRPSYATSSSDTSNSNAGSDQIDMEKHNGSNHIDIEKHNGSTNRINPTPDPDLSTGLTLLIKKSTGGMTRNLTSHSNLLTLLDGPYPNTSTKDVLRCDRLLLIGGGIGITSLLPYASNHPNVKLVWSLKESAKCLVDVLDGALSRIGERDVRITGGGGGGGGGGVGGGSGGGGRSGGTGRLNVSELLDEEVEFGSGFGSGGWRLGVVVSGPGGLCDDVRAEVARVGRRGKGEGKGVVVVLEVEAYSW